MSDKVKSPLTGRPITIGSSTFNSILKQGWKYIPDTKSFIKDEEDITPKPQLVATKPVIAQPQPVTQPQPTPPTIIPLNIPPDFHPKFIVHLSDIHIPVNLHISRQAEYDAVFQNLYAHLKTLPLHQTLIVVTGDLVNTKLKTENETLILAQSFLSILASLTHTIVIIGNHDFAENNTDRIDSITAICHTLPQVHALKYTAIYTLPGISLVFNSLFDQKFIKRKQVSDSSNPVYALYHGSLVGSTLDNGGAVTSHKTKFYPTIADFHGYDAVLLGHIHLRQFIRPNIAYAGSLIQQKFNEHPTQHGFILWNLETHTGQPVDIPNPYAYTILQVSNGTLDPQSDALLTSLKDKKLRIRCDITDTTTTQLQTLHDSIATQYHIETFTTKDITKHKYDMTSLTTTVESTLATDIELIQKMAKPTLVKDIIALHSQLRTQESIQSQSISWRPVYMEFTNLFIYGNNFKNTVNFLDGVVNICAPNTAGKSSIVNIMLFALFDGVSTCKSSKSDILHKGATHGYVSIDFLSNGVHYNIRKEASHKTRTAQRDSSSAIYKTTFTMHANGKQANLNGTSETATHKIIQEYVGTKEQFLSNCMICTRMAGTSLLNMSPAELAKHLHTVFNLTHYEDYITKVHSAHKIIKKHITKLETLNTEFIRTLAHTDTITINDKIATLQSQLHDSMQSIATAKKLRDHIVAQIATTTHKINTLKTQITTKSHTQLQELQHKLDTYPPNIRDKAQHYSTTAIQEQLQTINSHLEKSTTLHDKLQQLLDRQQHLQPLQPDNTKDAYLIELVTLRQLEKTLASAVNAPLTPIITTSHKSTLLEQARTLEHSAQTLESNITIIDNIPTLQQKCDILTPDDTPESLQSQKTEITIQLRLLQDKLSTIKYRKPDTDTDYGTIQPVPDRFHVDMHTLTSIKQQLDTLPPPDNTHINIVHIQDQQWVLYSDHLKYAKDSYFHTLQAQYTQLQQHIAHNLRCDAIIENNRKVTEYDAWKTYTQLQTEIQDLVKQGILIDSKLHATDLHKQLTLKLQHAKIVTELKHIKSQILWLDIAELQDTRQRLALITKYIQWYDEQQTIHDQLAIIHKQLDTAGDIESLTMQQQEWYQCLVVSHIQHEIQTLTRSRDAKVELDAQLSTLVVQEAQLQDADTEYISLETKVRTINTDISELTAAHETLRQVEARKHELDALLLQDTVYTEYDRLFNKNGIPATLLEQQLELLSTKVNTIFHKYTGKYHFRCVLDRRDDSGMQKIRLLIETVELVPLDYSRLSGFESVVLNIAINKALNDLERKTRSSIFVIDESLDCIDQDRFHQCLPDIFDLLRHNFATVLVISHRDIPRQLVDHNLTINKYDTYSTVDA